MSRKESEVSAAIDAPAGPTDGEPLRVGHVVSAAVLHAAIEHLPELAWTARADGFIDYYNRRWYAFTGTTIAQMEGWGWKSVHDPQMIDSVMARWQASIDTGKPFEMEFPLRRADGVYRWFLTRVQPNRDPDGKIVRWFGTNTDIDDLRRIRISAQFLADAGVLLGQSLDLPDTLDRVARLAVPGLSDWCALDLLTPEGKLKRVAVAHTDPQKVKLGHDLFRRYPTNLQDPQSQSIFRDGQSMWMEELPDSLLVQGAQDPEHLAALRALGMKSFVVAPLKAQGQVLGTVLLVQAESGRRFSKDDVVVAEELARRAALAVSNARLHEQVRHSEERYRSLIDVVNQLIWTTDTNGQMGGDQPGWRGFTGQTREQSAGLSWLQALHPEDRAATELAWRHAVATRSVFESEHRVLRRDGAYRSFRARAVPVQLIDGSVREWVGVHTDVTAQKEAEAALRLVADASSVAAESLDYGATLSAVAAMVVPRFADWCVIDLVQTDGTFKRVAVAQGDPTDVHLAEELRAMKPGHEAARQGKVISQRAQLIDIPAYAKAVEHDPARASINERMGIRSGIVAPLMARGRQLGVIGFLLKRTDRTYGAADLVLVDELARRAALAVDNAQLFEAVKLERDRVEEANRVKDAFLATVSHELRTPLTSVLGYASMLRSRTLSPERQARAIEVIDRNTRLQAQLIEDLLDISRIVSGKVRLDVKAVHPADAIDAAMDSVRPSADARGVRVTVVLDPAAGPIMGDSDRLQQIAWNLFTNAIKFTPRDGRVSAHLSRVNSHVELTVTDTGAGIDAEFLPHVFERFRQADSTSTRKHGGLGLGLAIVKHLVELHGGTIEAFSEGLGKGSSFTVKLPLAGARSSKVEPLRAHPGRGEPITFTIPPELDGLRILVVDDEGDTREMLRTVLEGCHAEVRLADSATAALTQLDVALPDLLLLDIGMPDEDGYALIRQIRERSPERGGRLPAIALTAFARMEDRASALMAGFTMHLAKPVEPAELVIAVASAARTARH
jgi:PAS domain S-box-containing protein